MSGNTPARGRACGRPNGRCATVCPRLPSDHVRVLSSLAHDAALGRDAGFVMVRARAGPSVLCADGDRLDLVLGPGVAGPVMRRLPRDWYRVPAGERVLHRLLGVEIFGWRLDRSGWNRRLAEPMRGFEGTRAGLSSLEQSVRGAASAHGTSFAIHVLLAAAALFTGRPWGALWILLPGVVLHLYPVLLQRSLMLRLQPLLDKSAS